MSRKYNQTSIEVLRELTEKPSVSIRLLFDIYGKDKPFKDFYNLIFRLESQGLLKKENKKLASITPEGKSLLLRLAPKTDGVWKIVIFDIPEKHQKVRNILRGKLKQLFF
jgi:predicted transcriptional regulator